MAVPSPTRIWSIGLPSARKSISRKTASPTCCTRMLEAQISTRFPSPVGTSGAGRGGGAACLEQPVHGADDHSAKPALPHHEPAVGVFQFARPFQQWHVFLAGERHGRKELSFSAPPQIFAI